MGTEQQLALTGVSVDVEPEPTLMSEPPRADLLLLRNHHPTWTKEQRARLPDGIRDSQASRILIEFKYTESINIKAIRQALLYDYLYMEIQLRDNPEFDGKPEEALETFLLSSMSPSKKRLAELGFYPAEKPGIYRSDDPIKGRVTILSLNDLARKPHNALVKCFASKPSEKAAAFEMLRGTGYIFISPKLFWLLEGLEMTLVKKGGLKMPETTTDEITADSLMELGKMRFEEYLPTMPIEMLLDYYPTERILPHLKPEDVLSQYKPEDVVSQYKPEDVLSQYKPEEIRQTPVVQQTLAENEQRTLLRLLRHKFGELPAEITKLVEQTLDTEQLGSWMDQLLDVDTLDDMVFH